MEDRSEIAFFDVETTVPTRPGQGFAILEFGAILVCPRKLVELQNYSTLVRPADLNLVSSLSERCNGITKDAVVSAPFFSGIADKIFDLLHGRIWAGHNILKFDCARIREAFAEIDRPPPEPKGMIDSLVLLTQRFGRRAGDMKMATLATYFGLGQQTHRSLDDVRLNLEVLKYCATVLLLESSLPDIFTETSPNATTRSRRNGKTYLEQAGQNGSMPSSSTKVENHSSSPMNHRTEESHPIFSLVAPNTGEATPNLSTPAGQYGSLPSSSTKVENRSPSPMNHRTEESHPVFSLVAPSTGEATPNLSLPARPDPFNMAVLGNAIEQEPMTKRTIEEGNTELGSEEHSAATSSGLPGDCTDFLVPEDIELSRLSATLMPLYRGIQKMQILHKDRLLQVSYRCLKVRFGISSKFVDHAGRPRLSFVADAPPSLCEILDAIDDRAQKLSMDSGSCAEWRRVVTRKPGFFNTPTIRLHLPMVANGDVRWMTEIYQKNAYATKRIVFSRFDTVELESLFTPGNLVDAYFSLDAYDYQQNAGIRLVAKKLFVHANR